MSSYKGYCIAILGKPHTGKSTLARNFYLESRKNKLIIVPDNEESLFHSLNVTVYDKRNEQKIIDLKNFLIVLDDFRFYSESNRDFFVRKLLIRRRQKQNNIILIAHSPNELPPSYWRFLTHVIILPVYAITDKEIEQRPQPDELKKAIYEANKTSLPQLIKF